MPLEETYPALAPRISELKNMGFAEPEIQGVMQSRIQELTRMGATVEEINQSLGEIPKPSIMEPIKGTARGVAETAVSMGPMFAGALLGPLGAAGGAGIGETLRQLFFDDEVKPETIALAAATGWIPGLKFSGVAKPLSRVALKAVEGGAFSGIQGEARKLVEEKGDYKFSGKDTAYNALLGMLFGTAFEGALPSGPKKVGGKAETKIAEPGLTPEQRSRLEAIASQMDELERLRQSPKGRDLLRQELAAKEAEGPTPAIKAADENIAKWVEEVAGKPAAGKVVEGADIPEVSQLNRFLDVEARSPKAIRAGTETPATREGGLPTDQPPLLRDVTPSAPGRGGPFEDIYLADRALAEEQHAAAQVGRATEGSEFMAEQFLSAKTNEGVPSPQDVMLPRGAGQGNVRGPKGKFLRREESPGGIMEYERLGLPAPSEPSATPAAPAPRTSAETAKTAPEPPERTISKPPPQEAVPAQEAQPAPRSVSEAGQIEGKSAESGSMKQIAEESGPPLRPAIRVDGEVKAIGKEGEGHAQVSSQQAAMLDAYLKNPNVKIESGWVDAQGKFLDNAEAASLAKPGPRSVSDIPESIRAKLPEELTAILNDRKANSVDQGYARRVLAEQAQRKVAAKPETIDQRATEITAQMQEAADLLGISVEEFAKTSVQEHIDRLKTPRGGTEIGIFSAQQQRDEMARRLDLQELFRKLHRETQENGLTLEQAAARYKLPYSLVDKMWRDLLYPTQHFSWENIEPDVLRNRGQEREVLGKIWVEAKKQNKPLSVIAEQQNIDPKALRNIAQEAKIDDFLGTLGGTIRKAAKLNERSKFLIAEAEAIQETGTIRPGSKETAREDVRPDIDTYRRKISEIGFDETRTGMIDALSNIKELANRQRQLGGGLTAKDAADISTRAASWVKTYNTYADKWFKDRAAWGRMGKAQQRPPVPADLIQFVEEAGVKLNTWRNHPERTPIYTSLWEARNWSSLTPSEKYQAQNNAVDALRLNLFPVTSWTLDTMLNAAETTTQIVSAAGADIGYALQTGKFTAPNLNAVRMAWRNATTDIKHRIYSPEFEEGIGFSAGGEPIPGNVRMRDLINKPQSAGDLASRQYWTNFFKTGQHGAFTERGSQLSAGLDTLAGTPMYAKGAVDTAFKRFSGSMSIYADALKAADAGGITLPAERKLFVKDYWNRLPKDALDRAIEVANTAGFNRELPQIFERMARSKMGQLFVDAFGRFSWQFLRWSGDMLGANPKIWRKIATGVKEGKWGLSPEETMRYLTRVAAGIGGLALIDSHFYDKTDFQSLEKIDENGDRMRLAGREPIATALFMSALIRGDWEKAQGAARYSSFPLLKFFYGEGGLLSSATKASIVGRMQGMPIFNENMQNELIDLINKAIPGQAILGAVKSLFDTQVREGIGANLPGVSLTKEPKIDLTTGQPLEVTQRAPLIGASMRTIQGTPIPGMYRELNPVSRMLSRYGIMTYRANRLPIAGEYPANAPDEINREWQIEFGKMRDKLQSKLVPVISQIEARVGPDKIQPGQPLYDEIRSKIKLYDAMAARAATEKINARTKSPSKLPRRITPREERMPTARSG